MSEHETEKPTPIPSAAPAPKGSRWMKRVIPAVVIIAAMLGYQFYNKGQKSAEAREAIQTWVVNAPGYATDTLYYESLLALAHEAAFGKSYDMGSRRRSASLDVNDYVFNVFKTMVERAKEDNRPEVAAELHELWRAYETAPDESAAQ
jgi:hypothetical protein